MKTFSLVRTIDPSGVSGLGKVAEGVIFGNGKCALTWLCPVGDVVRASVGVYDCIQDIIDIHGHNNSTTVVYD